MSRKIYFTALDLLFITIVSYLCVQTFYKFVTARLYIAEPPPIRRSALNNALEKPGNLPLSSYQTIVSRNLFNTKNDERKMKTPAKVPEPPQPETLKETDLKLKLFGTVTGVNPCAVIEDLKKRKQKLYAPGDTIREATVKQIFRDKVILTVNGEDALLKIEKRGIRNRKNRYSRARGRTGKVRKQKISVSRSRIERAMNDINGLMKQAKIRPHFKNGKPDGLTLSRIKRKSIFRVLGLRSGDIITGVNGNDIRSVDDALSFYDNLKSASDLSVQIKRRGRIREIEYDIR